MNGIKLSVVIITFNEEKNIDRCLASVKTIADEIVVLDSFSTDATKAICLQHGARFYEHSFDGHIQQKNRAITYATNPHILSLDADEALSPELTISIGEIKNNYKKDGYSMNRLTNYCGKWIYHCGWYPDKKLRLIDRRKGTWGGINPHDKMELSTGASEGFLKGDILHYSYYTIADHYKQMEYFSTIASQEYFKKGYRSNRLRMILNPSVKFIKNYFFQLGFLDGSAGFTISRISAYATYLKYYKLYKLQKKTAG